MAIAEASCALECHLAGCVTRGTGPLVKAPNNVCWLQWPQVAVAWAILKGVMGEGLRCLSFTCSPDDGGHIVVSVGFMVMTMLTIMNMEFVARQIFSIHLLWQIDETAKMPSSRSTLSWGGTKAGQHMMVNYASQNLSWFWFLARRGVEEDFFFFFFVFVSIVPRTTWWTRIARITFVLPLIPLHSSLPTASTLLPRGFGCFSDQTSPCSWRPFVKGLCDSQNLCVLGWERSTKFWLEWAGVTSEGQHNTESGIVQPTFPSWIEVRPEFKELVTLAVQRLKAVEASLDCWVRCRVFTESTAGWCHAGHEGTYICCHFAQHVYTWF